MSSHPLAKFLTLASDASHSCTIMHRAILSDPQCGKNRPPEIVERNVLTKYFIRRLGQSVQRTSRKIRTYSKAMGIELSIGHNSQRSLKQYFLDRREYLRLASQVDLDEFPFSEPHPCLADRYAPSGQARGHYFHQDLLVARRIFIANPARHIDIGSRIDGFVAHVATFRSIHVLDIRAQESSIPNVSFERADITESIPNAIRGRFDSASCLHALEHLGLGRYGDRIDPGAYRLGLQNLSSLLTKNGMLYLSVPIGPQRVEFNAHRVFSVRFLLQLVENGFNVERFSFVDDNGDLHDDVPLSEKLADDNYGCSYGCGIFELRKRGECA